MFMGRKKKVVEDKGGSESNSTQRMFVGRKKKVVEDKGVSESNSTQSDDDPYASYRRTSGKAEPPDQWSSGGSSEIYDYGHGGTPSNNYSGGQSDSIGTQQWPSQHSKESNPYWGEAPYSSNYRERPRLWPSQPPPNHQALPSYDGPPPMYNGPPPRYNGPPPMYNGPPPMYNGPPPMYNGPPPMYNGPRPMYNGPPPMCDGPPPMCDGPPPMYNGPPPMCDGPPPMYDGPSSVYGGRPPVVAHPPTGDYKRRQSYSHNAEEADLALDILDVVWKKHNSYDGQMGAHTNFGGAKQPIHNRLSMPPHSMQQNKMNTWADNKQKQKLPKDESSGFFSFCKNIPSNSTINESEHPQLPTSALKCHICDVTEFFSMKEYATHLVSQPHRQVVKQYLVRLSASVKLMQLDVKMATARTLNKAKKAKANGKEDESDSRTEYQKLLQSENKCTMCDVPVNDLEEHKIITEVQTLHRFMNPICTICDMKFEERINYENHLVSYDHLYNVHQKAEDTPCFRMDEMWERFEEEQKEMKEMKEVIDSKGEYNADKVITKLPMDLVELREHYPLQMTIKEMMMQPYDPSTPLGVNFLIRHSWIKCKICNIHIKEDVDTIENHFKSDDHFNAAKEKYSITRKEVVSGETTQENSGKENVGVTEKSNKNMKTVADEKNDSDVEDNCGVSDEEGGSRQEEDEDDGERLLEDEYEDDDDEMEIEEVEDKEYVEGVEEDEVEEAEEVEDKEYVGGAEEDEVEEAEEIEDEEDEVEESEEIEDEEDEVEEAEEVEDEEDVGSAEEDEVEDEEI